MCHFDKGRIEIAEFEGIDEAEAETEEVEPEPERPAVMADGGDEE